MRRTWPRLPRQSSWEEALASITERSIPCDASAYVSLLRTCTRLKACAMGRLLHRQITSCGQEADPFLGGLIVQMYIGSGDLADARVAFSGIKSRSVDSWNSMIGACAQHEKHEDGIQHFRQMQQENVIPDRITVINALSVCAELGDTPLGKEMHVLIAFNGWEFDAFASSALLNMYGKVGAIEDAQAIFTNMSDRNVFSWSIMASLYTGHGRSRETVGLFDRMLAECVLPNTYTIVSTLSACAALCFLVKGRHIHACIMGGELKEHPYVGNALVNMYGKCGYVSEALMAFDETPERDVYSWNVVLMAVVQNRHYKEAIQLFDNMQEQEVLPDTTTCVNVLCACAGHADLDKGMVLHAYLVIIGMEAESMLFNSLVTMYSKCGSLGSAEVMVKGMSDRYVGAWNALIAGYAQYRQASEVYQLFCQMLQEGTIPDEPTFARTLEAYASKEALAEGKRMHARVTLLPGFMIELTLINMYAKCGSLCDAFKIFLAMAEPNVLCWNAVFFALNQYERGNEALDLFGRMQVEGVVPDSSTISSVLSACASQAALGHGKKIHFITVHHGIKEEVVVTTALINMYGKCGSIDDGLRMFDKIPAHERDDALWTSVIQVCAQHGDVKESVRLFDQMQQEGVSPTKLTYLSILTACSHAGLVNEGFFFFNFMQNDHGVEPTKEHYDCMIDLLGRSGLLEDAAELIKKMPFKASYLSWITLLGACRIQADVDRSECIVNHIFEQYPGNTSPSLLLLQTYVAAGSEN